MIGSVLEPNDASLNDVIDLLKKDYDIGLIVKRRVLQDWNSYMDGQYSSRRIEGVGKQNPELELIYRNWFEGVIITLNFPIIPHRFLHDFSSTSTSTNLDLALSPRYTQQGNNLINKSFNTSLKALSNVIDGLKQLNSTNIKVVSLKKINHCIYLNIEPDNTDIKIHDFEENSPLEQLFDYVYLHPNEIVTTGQINLDTRGYNKKRNLSEDFRAMGFNNKLKQLFFSKCTVKEVMLSIKSNIASENLKNLLTGFKPDSK
ncbi:MAG: hypothetical protein M1554_02390 [Patescibacteria group bacterium]|jgi:hypothetical protein|nr:hypothetical protein [Patescibacteria group bacterium]